MTASEPLVVCEGASRTFGSGPTATVALMPINCEVRQGERVAVVGRSGSGKSTLLHLIAGLDEPTLGAVRWPAIGSAADLRPGPVAMVFQGPSLLAPLTVIENIALPLLLLGHDVDDAKAAAHELLERLGLGGLGKKLPEEISGGQMQRVAAARALIAKPRLILADEPTGQLDHTMAAEVVDELLHAVEATDAALVIATHDDEIAARLDQRWQIDSGRLAAGGYTEVAA